MYKILKYSNIYKKQWDDFINFSKNGTFLLKRDYMEYHKSKFPDTSYIILDEKDNIRALIAGTIKEKQYVTHLGLTYGGFILDNNSKAVDIIEYFELLNNELKKENIKDVIYKQIPYIYYEYPSEEDEYVLFNHMNAKLKSISISSTIDLQNKLKFNKSRKSSISKSRRYNLSIEKNKGLDDFWNLLNENLQSKYETNPVHTFEEINYLQNKFTDEIINYTVKNKEGVLVGGVVIFICRNVAHVQYISANLEGKKIGALDFLFDFLINEEFKDFKYFDFGTSTENEGKYLNENLIFQKEGFGARGVSYKKYIYKVIY